VKKRRIGVSSFPDETREVFWEAKGIGSNSLGTVKMIIHISTQAERIKRPPQHSEPDSQCGPSQNNID
jgi:hypothetical protein